MSNGADETRSDAPDEGLEDDAAGDRLTGRIAHQWHQLSQLRSERRTAPAPVAAGTSNFSRAHVPGVST